jgi:hypothetical protein
MEFGFNFNVTTADPGKIISFNEAIAPAPGAGPAACIYLYYSLPRAKEMLHQLRVAITQAEIAIAQAEAVNDLSE